MLPATVGREMPLIQIHNNNNKVNALETSLANKLPHPLRNNTSHSPNAGKLMGSRFLPPSVPMKESPLVKQEWVPAAPGASVSTTGSGGGERQTCLCDTELLFPELGPLDLSFRACRCYWPLNVLQKNWRCVFPPSFRVVSFIIY